MVVKILSQYKEGCRLFSGLNSAEEGRQNCLFEAASGHPPETKKKVKGVYCFCLRPPFTGTFLWHPVRENGQCFILPLRIIVGKVNSEIVFAAHITVHQEFHRKGCCFTRLEGHRTDGRSRGSTPLDEFYIGRFRKLKRSISSILEFERDFNRIAQFDIP